MYKKNSIKFYNNTILIFTLFSLISCGEKSISSTILNNLKNQITVKVKIDNNAVYKKRIGYFEKGYLFNRENPKDDEIKIDSAESYLFDISMHTEPDFYDIQEIEIYSGYTLILKCRRDQMKNLFANEREPGYLIIN